MYIIQEVQRECDTRVKNIIDAFKEQKEVSEKVFYFSNEQTKNEEYL